MTPIDIKELKKKLPRGWTTKISLITGVHYKTVWKVFNGLSNNVAVIDAGIDLIEQENQRSANIKKILES